MNVESRDSDKHRNCIKSGIHDSQTRVDGSVRPSRRIDRGYYVENREYSCIVGVSAYDRLREGPRALPG